MTITEGPDTMTEKAVKTRWPVEEGTTAGTTKQVGKRFLSPEGMNGVKSIVPDRKKAGL